MKKLESNHSLPVAENLLKQRFSASRPNQISVSNITYIGTNEACLYLASIVDLYSRNVVDWSMFNRMAATLVCDALRMALFARKRPSGAIVHTESRQQICSREQPLMDENGRSAGMSARNKCYDNAAMTSWKHGLKVESIHGYG